MKLQDGVTMTGCKNSVLTLADWLDTWANENKRVFVVSSGFRSPEKNLQAGGSPNSYHCKGLAIDFSFEGVNVFKDVSALYQYWLSGVGPWQGATEFEVCRGRGMNHIHVAFVPDKEKTSFTGVYRV